MRHFRDQRSINENKCSACSIFKPKSSSLLTSSCQVEDQTVDRADAFYQSGARAFTHRRHRDHTGTPLGITEYKKGLPYDTYTYLPYLV